MKHVIFGYVDKEDGQPMFWSNDDGWVSLDCATTFTDRERKTLNLPVANARAVWVQLPAGTYRKSSR